MTTLVRPDFEEYVRARSGALLRFAYLLCGDRHLAEDLVQDVLTKAYRRWSSIEADNPDAYVKRALVRTHVSWRRRRASSEVTTASFPDRAGGGFDDAHAAREEVWALLARLPRAQRAVLVLRYLEDLDDHRIADLVGVSASTVRVHAHRGLQALRETLAQREDEAPTGAGLLENVRRGASRASARRRALLAGGIAALVAALVLLASVLRPEPAVPPIEPTPSPTAVELTPTTLVAPEFPYAFSYVPPGLGPAYVARHREGPVLSYDDGDGQTQLSVSMQALPFSEMRAEDAVKSAVTVNGESATQWLRPPVEAGRHPVVFLRWEQDGDWFWAYSNGAVSPEDVRRVAEGMVPGRTVSARTGVFDDVVSVQLPAGYVIHQQVEQGICAGPAEPQEPAHPVCIYLVTEEEVAGSPHILDLLVDGDPAYVREPYPGFPELVVHRSDGRIVLIYEFASTMSFTTEDLIAIYRGIRFANA